MSKNITLLFLIALLISAASESSAQINIEGQIQFQKNGNIYVYLVDEAVFKTPFTGIQDTLIHIGEAERKKQMVAFTFKAVKPGTYGIRCFQDVNGNGKLDKGLFGPKEPWGMSWQKEKPAMWPKFKDIAFQAKSDIKGLKIQLR